MGFTQYVFCTGAGFSRGDSQKAVSKWTPELFEEESREKKEKKRYTTWGRLGIGSLCLKHRSGCDGH